MPRLIAGVVLIAALGAGVHTVTTVPASAKSFELANDAWERGDYIAALTQYLQVMNAAGGDRFLESIALTTGELFDTRELTTDGRAPRFSPDGRFIVYETGLETSRRTKILKNDASRAEVADLPGVSATFSSTLPLVAYLRIPENDEIRRASEAIEKASLTASNRNLLTQTLTWLIAKHAAILVRDLGTGREMELPAPDLLKTGLTFSADGRTLYFLGAKETDVDRTDVYAISEASPKPVVAVDAPGLKSAVTVDPAGKVLIYTVPAQNPLRRPTAGGARGGGTGQAGAVEAADTGRGGAAPQGGPRQPSTFGVVNLATRTVSLVAGTAPALSADGGTLAFIARTGPEYALMVGPTTGAHAAIRRTTLRLDAPALSAGGDRVAFQTMFQDDWEIVVANRDGSGERRITREIQHDLLPRFVGPDRILALVGEARHRRSYLYDLKSDSSSTQGGLRSDSSQTRDRLGSDLGRVRVFHNNTVRTIAPEYQWAVNPAGTQILIGAERDGNTVSPERGVYVVDLQRRITKATLIARLEKDLRSETALKAAGTRAFQPIAADVRRVVGQVSVARIFGYEKALFDFDSKHISKPGNRHASEFLFNTYKSFGYEPEYQWFEPSTGRAAFGAKTANVVATLRGTVNPDLVYVVSSHYDSVEAGPGADDDSSGTAALLEAARVLAGHPMPATIVFASFTGEEAGLLGSREFVRRAVAARLHVAGALNNDMIGWMNDHRLDNTIRYSNPGIRDIQHAAAMLFTRLITYDSLYFKSTDAASLYDAYGDIVGGIGSYPVLGSPHYHQASDLLEFEDHQLIAETSKTTVATVMLLASSPSRLTQLKVDSYTGGTASLSWQPGAEKGLASYIVAHGPAADPLRHRLVVVEPHVTIPQIAAGSTVSVKGVNATGLEGWDWARVAVGEPRDRTVKTQHDPSRER